MIEILDELDDDRIARLAGAGGLSDEARVRLRGRRDDVVHLIATGRPDAYAQLDRRDGALELVTDDPGVATSFVRRAAHARGGDVLVWSRDPDAAVAGALRAVGATEERVLWRLHRGDLPLPAVRPLPEGVTLRTFAPGRDEDAWLAVNAAAFARHPEQGRLTHADLDALEAEPWFDPAGFLLAERAGDLVGFHWTKVHAGPPRVGEVYVLGVAPTAQGTGLGGALLDAGLAHLRDEGLGETILYVDDDNRGALAMYERAGFTRADRDVRYRVAHDDVD